jgi:hypothetical protein
MARSASISITASCWDDLFAVFAVTFKIFPKTVAPNASAETYKQKALTLEGFPFYNRFISSRQSHAKFFDANSQLTMFQYASTNFGRALR